MRDEHQHQHHKNLSDILSQLIVLLEKQELEQALVEKQHTPHQDLVQSLVKKKNVTQLQQKVQQLHPADVAFILERLPLNQRKKIWDLVNVEHYGAILLEVSDGVRESLIADMAEHEIIVAAKHLDSDEIADLVPDLPRDIVFDLLTSLDSENRDQVQKVMIFPEGTAGALMDFDMVMVREDVTIEVVLRYLRWRKQIPPQTDQLFVVDSHSQLKGLLPLHDLITHPLEKTVAEVMMREPIFFYTNDALREVAEVFERYDLISAPVVNSHQQLVGCIGIDVVLDFVNEQSQKEKFNQVGLHEEEDLFAPIWKSGRNRWVWLALNLMTAFIASRVIGLFEDTIGQLVALATLMPIVASIGGNTGNQTAALIIRGLALKQINGSNFKHLIVKELGISLMNGLLWGAVVGLFAYLIYQNIVLAGLIFSAMILNLLIAALAGVFIPMGLHKVGRDPVMGSSVMLTAITDSMGFFIFLGLATLFI
jgi:magnesium transporter